jgi:hypothetical protein
MLDGELAPSTVAEAAIQSLPGETAELNVEEILGQLRTIYWRFTPEDARRAMAPRVERLLRRRLDAVAPEPKGDFSAPEVADAPPSRG